MQPALEPSRSAYCTEFVLAGNCLQPPKPSSMETEGLMRLSGEQVVSPLPYSLKRKEGSATAKVRVAVRARREVGICILKIVMLGSGVDGVGCWC